MFVTAIIAAGGRGTRFGGTRPKQLMLIGGRPILDRSVSAFTGHPLVHEVVVSLPGELAGDPPEYLRQSTRPVRVVAGGVRRQDSVANAFRAIDQRSEVVIIHDAARPFVSADLITRTIAAAAECGAAAAAMPARDTVKRAETDDRRPGGGESARSGDAVMVVETLPRETIFLAQTPQAFRPDVLRSALALGITATDEAALAEKAGHRVRLVQGEATNIKVTTPEDLVFADAIARSAGLQAAPEPATISTGSCQAGRSSSAASPSLRPSARPDTPTLTSPVMRSPMPSSVPPAAATSASTFPTTIRGGRTRQVSICSGARRNWRRMPASRSPMLTSRSCWRPRRLAATSTTCAA